MSAVPTIPHTVVETSAYLSRCGKLGLTTEQREAIVSQVAADPEAGVVIKGSGGARKVRFGGSGGYRILLAYFHPNAPVYLLSILAKNQQANFTDAQIATLHALTKAIKAELRVPEDD